MFDILARIKDLREARGWSVYKLAKLSGIPQSTIATWYQKNLCPPIDKLEIICDVFDITLSEFFNTGREESNMLTNEHVALLKSWECLQFKERVALLTVIDAFLS